jgi:hypothetical protein
MRRVTGTPCRRWQRTCARGAACGPLDFDLDLRLACIYARDHSLPGALQRLDPWRKRTADQPAPYEARVAPCT